MNTKGKPELSIFSKVDKIVFSILGILTVLTIVFWKSVQSGKEQDVKVKKVKTGKNSNKDSGSKKNEDTTNIPRVTILEKWDMPADLKEVSGISYLDDQRFACVQDEVGSIFIFNRTSNRIENKIPFAQKGDYEGIAVKENTAYVLRADGKLFEVDISNSGKNAVREYQTGLTVKHNVEGLCYDKDNNRLLLAIKDEDPNMRGYKGVYAFDLAKKSFVEEPVLKIDLSNSVINTSDKKVVSPSEIAIHPKTNEIFITDGPQSKLLIIGKNGQINRYLPLGKDFSQPEGITFSPEGEMFISNEGTKESGNILKVELK